VLNVGDAHVLVLQMRAVASTLLPSPTGEHLLEVESDLSRKRTRRCVVRSAEGGKKVVQSVLVCDVDGRELQTHLVIVTVEHVVVSDGNVEKAPRHLLTLAVDAHRDPICTIRLHGPVRSIRDCEGLSQSFRSCGSTMLCLI
jgi:hypothetical protein